MMSHDENNKWDAAGFIPEEAAEWISRGFGPVPAAGWRKAGVSPIDAAKWIDAIFSTPMQRGSGRTLELPGIPRTIADR